jgi:DNA-binding Lrp family transcriptional regulator
MVSAYVLVSVEAGRSQDVLAALRTMAEVREVHACWGQPDIFAFVQVDNEADLAEAVLTRIQGIPGIRATQTHVVVPI